MEAIVIMGIIILLVAIWALVANNNELKRDNKNYQNIVNELHSKLYNAESHVNDLERQLNTRVAFLNVAGSNLSAIPYMAKIIADYETYHIEQLAQTHSCGSGYRWLARSATIKEIREEARAQIEQSKEAEYQLAYLLKLYPMLIDVLETDYKQLPEIYKRLAKANVTELKQENENYKKHLCELPNVAKSNLTAIPYMTKIIADYETHHIQQLAQILDIEYDKKRLDDKAFTIRHIRAEAKACIEKSKEAEYQLAYLLTLYPMLIDVLNTDYKQLPEIYKRLIKTNITELKQANENYKKHLYNLSNVAKSNLSAIPYMAKLIADCETYHIELVARTLDWGYNEERLAKVVSIREIREEAQHLIEQHKEAEYQLAYLLELYPVLEDVIETDYKQLPKGSLEELPDHDPSRSYLSREEYNALSETERNQLALDRYIGSHNKTKWQIGRDYELFNGYQYEQQGGNVEYFGSNEGLEDLGRDLIVHQKDGPILIVQCKYWANKKLIHEKHIMQLYGTTICYAIEHNLFKEAVKCLFITNIELSPMAKKMANSLGVEYKENVQLGDFPRIKCNNGKDENGNSTKIYHLPFDQQYDKVQLKHKDDCWAYTVKDAESMGYRRAKKWFGA